MAWVRMALSFRIGSLFWRARKFAAPEKSRLNGADYYLSFDGPRPHSFRSDIGRVKAGSVRIFRSAIFFRYRT